MNVISMISPETWAVASHLYLIIARALVLFTKYEINHKCEEHDIQNETWPWECTYGKMQKVFVTNVYGIYESFLREMKQYL